MKLFFDSFWRALGSCLQTRVVLLSLLPLLLMASLTWICLHFFWIDAQKMVGQWAWLTSVDTWLIEQGLPRLQSTLSSALLLCLITPLALVLSLWFVATFTTPSMLKLVSDERFSTLEKRHGGSFWVSIFGSMGLSLLALLMLLLSMPFWLIPPLMMVLPPLIWGWLTYRVMSYDVLSEHASEKERLQLMLKHRWPLLTIGLATGYLGAVPCVVWGSGVLFVLFAPFFIPLAIWLYTMVFAFASLWFAHYALSALADIRHTSMVDRT
jgi:Etoposide-induced protein 2.4 (EI24)